MGKFHLFFTELSACHMFQDKTLVYINGFLLNLICALVLWQSVTGLLMGKFDLFLTELSASHKSEFWFSNNSLSKYQWFVH